MSEWQAIETAPKNPTGESYGPWILVFYRYDHCAYQARFECRGDERGWYAKNISKALFGHCVTHWMPRPNPPKQEA